MSRLFRFLSIATIASSSTIAIAQQPATSLPGQPGQVQPVQPGQPAGRPAQPGQAGQAHSATQAQGVSLNAFIAHKLKRGNEAEVELGQVAVDKAKDDSVKEFAQMMVKTHQQMIQKLAQFDEGVGSTGGARNPGSKERRGEGTEGQKSTKENSEGSSGNDSAQGTANPNQAGQPVAGQTPGQSGPNQPGNLQRGQAHAGGMTGHVPHMLVALTDQTCDNELQLTRKMLDKHEGENFDMAYIGQQIVAHTCMLAHLQALKDTGPQELQQLVTQGEKATREHLDKAMKIAEDLGDEKK